MKMKAAGGYETGKPLSVEEVEIDSPHPNEVLVRMAATAVCHSDINIIRGERGGKFPLVVGHESAGYIIEIGKNVTTVKPGDPVVVSLLSSCRRCHYCVTGMPWICVERKGPQPGDARLKNKAGQVLTQGYPGARVASFAEYVVVDESQTVVISKDFPMDVASLLACGVITGFGAVVNRAKVPPMSSVVVVGVGGVGLNSVQGAAISGANPIIAVDLSDYKLDAARKFGATHTVRADDKDAINKVKELTSGRGAEFAFITVGSAPAVEQGFNMTGPRGMTVVVGLPRTGSTITLAPFFSGEKMLTSSAMGSTRLSDDIPKLIDLYRAGRLKLDELITNRFSLDQINEAIESTERGEALRNVITFKL